MKHDFEKKNQLALKCLYHFYFYVYAFNMPLAVKFANWKTSVQAWYLLLAHPVGSCHQQQDSRRVWVQRKKSLGSQGLGENISPPVFLWALEPGPSVPVCHLEVRTPLCCSHFAA